MYAKPGQKGKRAKEQERVDGNYLESFGMNQNTERSLAAERNKLTSSSDEAK